MEYKTFREKQTLKMKSHQCEKWPLLRRSTTSRTQQRKSKPISETHSFPSFSISEYQFGAQKMRERERTGQYSKKRKQSRESREKRKQVESENS